MTNRQATHHISVAILGAAAGVLVGVLNGFRPLFSCVLGLFGALYAVVLDMFSGNLDDS